MAPDKVYELRNYQNREIAQSVQNVQASAKSSRFHEICNFSRNLKVLTQLSDFEEISINLKISSNFDDFFNKV